RVLTQPIAPRCCEIGTQEPVAYSDFVTRSLSRAPPGNQYRECSLGDHDRANDEHRPHHTDHVELAYEGQDDRLSDRKRPNAQGQQTKSSRIENCQRREQPSVNVEESTSAGREILDHTAVKSKNGL